jgi:hypothetical protein
MPLNSQVAPDGSYPIQSQSAGDSASLLEDQYRTQAESTLPGWKVERTLPTGGGAICLLSSTSAPAVRLVLKQANDGSTSLDAFKGQSVAIAAFAQAFTRKHPGTEWAVSPSAPADYRPPGSQGASYGIINVSFIPLASFNNVAESGDPIHANGEEWIYTGTDNSVSWLSSDDPRAAAILQPSGSAGFPSGTYPTAPAYPPSGGYPNPQEYPQNGANSAAPR